MLSREGLKEAIYLSRAKLSVKGWSTYLERLYQEPDLLELAHSDVCQLSGVSDDERTREIRRVVLDLQLESCSFHPSDWIDKRYFNKKYLDYDLLLEDSVRDQKVSDFSLLHVANWLSEHDIATLVMYPTGVGLAFVLAQLSDEEIALYARYIKAFSISHVVVEYINLAGFSSADYEKLSLFIQSAHIKHLTLKYCSIRAIPVALLGRLRSIFQLSCLRQITLVDSLLSENANLRFNGLFANSAIEILAIQDQANLSYYENLGFHFVDMLDSLLNGSGIKQLDFRGMSLLSVNDDSKFDCILSKYGVTCLHANALKESQIRLWGRTLQDNYAKTVASLQEDRSMTKLIAGWCLFRDIPDKNKYPVSEILEDTQLSSSCLKLSK